MAVLNIDTQQEHLVIPADIENETNSKELLKMVMSLPPAYKMVFNLYITTKWFGRLLTVTSISYKTKKNG